ncbi:MAG TPA: RidA family protein [Candidatus Cybelea sp.]|nr:RidA family protein [Candidatus Cybelea sp.]
MAARRQKRVHFPAPQGFGPLPFSNGVLAGDTFYLAGHIGIDPATKKVPESVEREIELMMDALGKTLGKAGFRVNDLVFVQVFCSDLSLFPQFNAAYRAHFTAPFPARAFIGSGPLLFGARFEIQGIAVKTR